MSTRKLSVLIGGGRGFIGTRLTNKLKRRGHFVQHISRSRVAGAVTWDDINEKGIPDGVNAVINLAGENVINPMKRFSSSFWQEVCDSRIITTKSIVQAIKRSPNPPEVFVCASGVGYYNPDADVAYTEDSPSTGSDSFSKLSRDWEAAAQIPPPTDTRQVTVRIGVALGREGGTIKNMIVPFWLGLGGPLGSGRQWFPWVHVDDVAGVFTHAVENAHVAGVLNAVAPDPKTNRDFTSAFGRALWRPAFIPLPGFVLKAAFGADVSDVFVKGQQVIPKRTLESGYQFRYPHLEEACREFAHLLPNEMTV